MTYQVVWRPEAEDEPARLWNDAADRNAVAAAADSFDAAIAKDPLGVGEAIDRPSRIAFIDPLAFIFDVFPQSGQVLVKTVWRSRP
jgi:hypothetical protein